MNNEELRLFLESALSERERELAMFAIDQSNFEYSLEEIDRDYANDPDMSEFREDLVKNIQMCKVQKTKCQLIRNSLQTQLDPLPPAEATP